MHRQQRACGLATRMTLYCLCTRLESGVIKFLTPPESNPETFNQFLSKTLTKVGDNQYKDDSGNLYFVETFDSEGDR